MYAMAGQLRNEYVLAVSGVVESRGENVNPKMKTGEIEVLAKKAEIMNAAKMPPFHIRDDVDTSEELRLKYRFLDLRRPQLQQVLMLRSRVNRAVREALLDREFIELETPILTKATPEGARIPCTEPGSPERILCAASEPTALQTALYGGRLRSLLPDLPLLS